MSAKEFAAGGYRYLPGVSQYSGGVAAMAGHEIVRLRFRRRLPLGRGSPGPGRSSRPPAGR
ncbi:MAG: hypothetical protein R3C69_15080 [Geminicoccaceae bacterium]